MGIKNKVKVEEKVEKKNFLEYGVLSLPLPLPLPIPEEITC
jgi:hypothetical protein